MKYNTENWKYFKVKDVFKVEGKGKRWKSEDFKGIKSGYHVKSGSLFNNGNSEYFSTDFDNKGNCLTVEGLTIGKTFYQDEGFKSLSDMTIIRNEKINRYSGLFLVSLFDLNTKFYGYGYKRVKERIRNETIKLPVKEDGSVDWEFMENQGKLAENEAIKNSPLYEKIKIIIDQENKK
jgi:type I restriction enzyme M protein